MYSAHVMLIILIGTCNFGIIHSNSDVYIDKSKCFELVLKSEWGGIPPREVTRPFSAHSYVLFHHTCTAECDSLSVCSWNLRTIQDHHMSALGWTDIAYSFYIGGDGRVYQGRGWNAEGPMVTRWYAESLTIGFIGDYSVKSPSELMLKTARKFVDCGISMGMLPKYVKVATLQQVTSVRYPAPKLHREIEKWPEWMAGSP